MRRAELEFFEPFASNEEAEEHYTNNPYAHTFEDSVIISRVAPYSVADAVAAHEAGDDSLLEINYVYRENLNI